MKIIVIINAKIGSIYVKILLLLLYDFTSQFITDGHETALTQIKKDFDIINIGSYNYLLINTY